ncbi:porin [Hyphomicrobium nitrativorans NL23]|uniref:Porin n=1 Tax=Hyphomicrobium nitrativorans NL23 TaxID=1029756 RepID=V5SD00_9HYPH|nr:porin [Hyphomicrobium nitrativorans NL23]
MVLSMGSALADDAAFSDTLTGDWGGVRSALDDRGISIGATYTGEALRTLSGGSQQGTAFEGLVDIAVDTDLEKLVGWRGATTHIRAFQIHNANGENAADYAGAISDPSNIDALATTRLFTVWLQQEVGDAGSIRVGQLAADDEFFISDTAGGLINGTFGWGNNFAANLPSGGPGYPLATPGVRGKISVSENVSVLGAVFSGDPAGRRCYRDDPEADPQACNDRGTTFSFSGGALWFGEAQYLVNQGDDATGLAAAYKVGGWYHTGRFADRRFGLDAAGGRVSMADPTVEDDDMHDGNWGIYGVADQMIWRGDGSSLSLFLRGGVSPSNRNLVSWYVDGGIGLKGVFPGRDEDALTFGIAHTHVSGDLAHLDRDVAFFSGAPYPVRTGETVLELSYAMQVAPWWVVQPDIQYIIRPGGGDPHPDDGMRRMENAFVLGVRSEMNF